RLSIRAATWGCRHERPRPSARRARPAPAHDVAPRQETKPVNAAITTVTVIDRDAGLTVGELARACHAETAWVAELVEVGIVRARGGGQPADWVFHGEDLLRARQVRRLQRDFGVEL